MVFSVSNAYCQIDKTQVSVSPFSRGDFWFNAGNNYWLDLDNLKTGGVNQGKESSDGLSFNTIYFPVDHFGAGLSLTSSRDNNKYTTYTDLSTSTMVYLNAMYGNTFGNNINLYAKAGVGFGSDRSKETSSMSTNYNNKYNDFGANFEVGSPFAIGNGTGLYFTPMAGYEFYQSKNSIQTDKSSGAYLATEFRASLPCSSYAHNCTDIHSFSENRYEQGNNFIGGTSSFLFRFGNDDLVRQVGELGHPTITSKYSYSNAMLDIDYYHYILNNVAAGAGLSLNSSMTNYKGQVYKTNNFSWTFSPEIQANLPVKGELNNVFGFLEAGIGTSRYKTDNNNSTSTYKYNLSDETLGAGYNLFFAKQFAFTPYIDYRWNTTKDQSTKIKTVANGFEAGIVLRYSFRF